MEERKKMGFTSRREITHHCRLETEGCCWSSCAAGLECGELGKATLLPTRRLTDPVLDLKSPVQLEATVRTSLS